MKTVTTKCVHCHGRGQLDKEHPVTKSTTCGFCKGEGKITTKCHCEPWHKYQCHGHRNYVEKLLREYVPIGMRTGLEVQIDFFIDFEAFNNRPYHNYETWAQGFRVRGKGVYASAENLEPAVEAWVAAYERLQRGEAKPWEIDPNTRPDRCNGWLDRVKGIIQHDNTDSAQCPIHGNDQVLEKPS